MVSRWPRWVVGVFVGLASTASAQSPGDLVRELNAQGSLLEFGAVISDAQLVNQLKARSVTLPKETGAATLKLLREHLNADLLVYKNYFVTGPQSNALFQLAFSPPGTKKDLPMTVLGKENFYRFPVTFEAQGNGKVVGISTQALFVVPPELVYLKLETSFDREGAGVQTLTMGLHPFGSEAPKVPDVEISKRSDRVPAELKQSLLNRIQALIAMFELSLKAPSGSPRISRDDLNKLVAYCTPISGLKSVAILPPEQAGVNVDIELDEKRIEIIPRIRVSWPIKRN